MNYLDTDTAKKLMELGYHLKTPWFTYRIKNNIFECCEDGWSGPIKLLRMLSFQPTQVSR